MGERILKQPKRGTLALAAVAAGSLLATGCSSERPEAKATVTCQAQNPKEWRGMPSDVQLQKLADRLHVSVGRVRAGKIGSAVCQKVIGPAEIAKDGPPIVEVRGISEVCLPFAVHGPDFVHIMAACAEPRGGHPPAIQPVIAEAQPAD